MPLETLEDYARLGEHLFAIDEPLKEFARRHGYEFQPHPFGRYPNRGLLQVDEIHRSIQIQMEERPDGQRFDCFFPEIPYSIAAIGWIDDLDDLTRWHCATACISRVPFTKLTQTLPVHQDHLHHYLQNLTVDYVKACSQASKLAPLLPDIRATYTRSGKRIGPVSGE